MGLLDSVSEENLPEFVVGHNHAEERERGHGEMGEGDLTGSEGSVEPRDVTEDGDKGSLEEETEVGASVDHALLGDGEGAGLADHEIGPLHAHDGDEVTSLGVSKSLSGVADLGA
jgi:hypothetical protein